MEATVFFGLMTVPSEDVFTLGMSMGLVIGMIITSLVAIVASKKCGGS